jgi:hypothetical protein
VRWARILPALGAVAILVIAAIAYVEFIPVHHVEQSRLSQLVVTKPPAGFSAKPTSSATVPASSSPFAALKTAAKRSPNQTGAYVIQWPGTGTQSSSSDVASVVLSWLPSTSDAATVQKQAVSAYLAAGSFKTDDSYSLESRFAVAGVPGAAGVIFGPAPSTGHLGLAVAVLGEGRFVSVDFAQLSSPAPAQAAATSLAQAEYAHLRQVGPGFTLGVTHYPLEASLILIGVAVTLAALLVLVPLGVSRGRRHRRLAREAASRRAVQGRGRKIAKHHAARSR